MSGEDPVRVDPHVKLLDESIVERAKARGLDVLVYAPHFTRLPEIRERAERFSDDDLLVVPGRELFTGSWKDRKHVLALGLEEPVPDFLTLEATMRELRRQSAAVIAPHPGFLTVSLGNADVRRYRETIDAVETHNLKVTARGNRRARNIATRHNCAPLGCSYAHLARSVGLAWTEFDTGIETEADLVHALRTDASRRTLHRTGVRYRLGAAAERTHLLYENTWKKADRILMQGTEPTHPRHLAYEGRFDEDSVY